MSASEQRWELIDGQADGMTPAPTTAHRRTVGKTYSRLEAALAGHPHTAFIAPTDVGPSQYDVVQPDVLVVRDEPKNMSRPGLAG